MTRFRFRNPKYPGPPHIQALIDQPGILMVPLQETERRAANCLGCMISELELVRIDIIDGLA